METKWLTCPNSNEPANEADGIEDKLLASLKECLRLLEIEGYFGRTMDDARRAVDEAENA